MTLVTSSQHRCVPIRCPRCGARLFDTSGTPARSDEPGVEIRIKCWRCKQTVAVRVMPAKRAGVLESAARRGPDAGASTHVTEKRSA